MLQAVLNVMKSKAFLASVAALVLTFVVPLKEVLPAVVAPVVDALPAIFYLLGWVQKSPQQLAAKQPE